MPKQQFLALGEVVGWSCRCCSLVVIVGSGRLVLASSSSGGGQTQQCCPAARKLQAQSAGAKVYELEVDSAVCYILDLVIESYDVKFWWPEGAFQDSSSCSFQLEASKGREEFKRVSEGGWRRVKVSPCSGWDVDPRGLDLDVEVQVLQHGALQLLCAS
eukprot:3745520-Rhodomonas_salina.2